VRNGKVYGKHQRGSKDIDALIGYGKFQVQSSLHSCELVAHK
jgi:hypothetical protein